MQLQDTKAATTRLRMANKANGTLERVCVVTSTFADGAGQVLLSQFLEVLEPVCERVFVITGAFEDESKSGKINVIRLSPHAHKRTSLKILRFIGSQVKICRSLLRVRRNINIVMFYINATSLVIPLIFSKVLKKKTVLVVSASDSRMAGMIYQNYLFGIGGKAISAIFKVLERVSYYFTDRIIIDSERLIADLSLKSYQDKVIVTGVRKFIDNNTFKAKKPLKERGNLIGYVGRLSYEKGVMSLVRAIPLALRQRDDLDFLIGGDGPLLDSLREEVKRFGLDSKVKFTGWIAHDELAGYLNELKLLVLPSDTEGSLPNVVLEAMACGTPVLATSVGPIPDYISDGDTGFILQSNCPVSIAEEIIRVLNHPNLEQIAQNARALVEREFTFDKAVESYREILNNL